MVQQTINIGAAANDGTGDPLRTAFSKANANFGELYTRQFPLESLSAGSGANGQALVLVNGVWSPTTLAAGTAYVGTAPISVSGNTISVTTGTALNTVAAGNDSRIVGALQAAAIPAASGQLLGGSGTAGSARAVLVGGGLQLASGTLSATASGVSTPRVITSGASVTVNASDGLIVINKTSGSATAVALEVSPTAGTVHRIKDGRGDAATNPITITPASGTIDGAASFVLNANRASVTMEYTGFEWSIT